MTRQWHIRHQFHATEDGVRRWDQAYQLLLHWSPRNESPPASAPPLSTQRPRRELMSTAVYVRVSTQRQSQAQMIDQQLARLRAHLAAQGEELQSAQMFRDDGYRGATLNRPGLDHLRDAVKAAAFARVRVTTPDRLARYYVHHMVLLEELERMGCRVEVLERPMRQDPHDQLLVQLRRAVAEYERTLIAERMRPARRRRSATHPIGQLAQGWDPVAPEA